MTSYDEIREVQDLAGCETEESYKKTEKIIGLRRTSKALNRSIIVNNLCVGFDAIITILIQNNVIEVKNSTTKLILIIIGSLSIIKGINRSASLISEKTNNENKIKRLEKED